MARPGFRDAVKLDVVCAKLLLALGVALVSPAMAQQLPVVHPESAGPMDFPLSWFGSDVCAIPCGPSSSHSRLIVVDPTSGGFWVLSTDGTVLETLPHRGRGLGGSLRMACETVPDVDGDAVTDFAVGIEGAWTVYSGATCAGLWAELDDELCAVGDVDGDGVVEFACASSYQNTTDTQFHLKVSLRSYRGERARWNFDAPVSHRYQPHHLLAAGDVDGDAHPDVIALVEDGAVVLSGVDGHRIARWADGGKLPVGRVARLGDIDGDGYAEFVLGYPDASCTERRLAHVDVVSSKDGSRLLHLTDSGGMFGSDIAAGADLDGDTRADILVASHSGDWEGVRAYSSRTGAVLRQFSSDWDCHRQFAVAFVPDANGDGVDDIAIGATAWPGANCDHGSVSLWSGRDGANLQTWTWKSPAIQSSWVAARDAQGRTATPNAK